MKRRRILIAIAALLGLLVLAVGVFVASFDANRYKPQLIELVREHTGRELRLEGDLSLSLWPRLALSTGQASLSGVEGRGEAVRFESGRVAVALRPLLSRQLVIEGLEAEGLHAAAGPGGPGSAGGWHLANARLETGRIASGEPGVLQFEGRLVPPGAGEPLALVLRAPYVADFAHRTVRLEDLDARVDGQGGEFAGSSARLGADLEADLAASRIDARSLTLEAALPGGAQLALAGSGQLDLGAGHGKLALEGRLDESALRLRARAPTLEPLALRYELNADRVDVERLRARLGGEREPPEASSPPPAPPAPPTAPQAGQAAPTPVPTRPAWPLASIGALDTEGSIEVGRLMASGVAIETLTATATTGGNRVKLEPMAGRIEGGSLRAGLELSEAGHRLQASLSGVDAGALIQNATRRKVLQGRGELELALTAHGDTAEALTRSLSGTASFALRDGAVEGVDLDRLMRAVRAALDGRLPVEQRATQGERAPFSSLSASFGLTDGFARSEDLELRANWVRAAGTGTVDLNARTLDWLVRATLTGPANDDPARRDALARLQGLTVPIQISGPFDDIGYRVEVKDLIGDAARRELGRRLEKELGERLGLPPAAGKPGDRGSDENPLDRLRDLLRR